MDLPKIFSSNRLGKLMDLTDFRLSQWFIVDVDSACGSLHHVDVGSVAKLSEVHAASIFRVRISWVGITRTHTHILSCVGWYT
jgi:hypothetical protein